MLGRFLIFFTALNTFTIFVFSEDTVIVELPNGKIQGRIATTFANTTFYAFQEVPYAAPPIGNLRFKAPVTASSWDGILETTRNTKLCYQLSGANARENEDCLYLNVYTPVQPNAEEKLPVLFYIHGGGFVFGDGTYESNGPDFLMDTKKIVVVTVNYRLGIFGFLSTEDAVIPGNNGLKDQQFALQWVQKNIHLFGGDSKKVTIDGQSAGSASVSYHVLSKKSQGLFRAAILESGTVLTTWSYQRYAKSIAYRTAAAVDDSFTENNSTTELLTLLQGLSAEDLRNVAATIPVPSNHINPGYSYSPVVEHDDIDEAFTAELPYVAVSKGDINKVPLMIGMTSEETIAKAGDLKALKNELINYDNDLSLIVNDDFHIENQTLQTQIGELLRKTYTDGLFQDDLGASIRFLSDCRYTTSIIKYAQLVSNFTDVYFYQFSYDGDLGNLNAHIDGAESVGHAEELQYLWKNGRNQDISKFSETDILTHKRLVDLWTNFITELNPVPKSTDLLNTKWPQFTPENNQYLDIRAELQIKIDPKEKVYPIWNGVYQKYGVQPFDTY